MSREQDGARRRGTLCVAAAALLFSIGGLCFKVIPWNALSINSARNMLALMVIGIFLMATKHTLRMNRYILLGAFCVCGTNVFYSLANKLTTAANTIVLQFTAPIFVIVLGALLWKRKPKKLDIIACAVVLFGVVCFFVDGLSMGGMLGNILALISGITYAGVFMLNEMPDADPICSVFWADFMSVVIGLPFLLQETDFSARPLIGVAVLGIFQVGIAYVLMCIGLKTTPSVRAALITGIEPVLNPLLVAIFYREAVGPLALIGAVIVIFGVVWYNVKKGKETSA